VPHSEQLRPSKSFRRSQRISQAQPEAFDWKTELKDLKEAFDAGLVPEDLYKSEAPAVMRRRSEMR
jgi:hypothetical protein